MLSRILLFAGILTFAVGVSAATAAPIGTGTIYGARDLGRASASAGVRVAVVLKYHRDAELEALTEAQADPDSPVYQRFLTPAQFANYFSPTAAEYGRVVSSLQRGGFTITHTFPNRTVIDAVASAPVAARYFSTD